MKISIITPSFNQGCLLKNTIDSIINQQVADLEYIVIDGGSSDGSREIIESYSDRVAYWCSESDRGQYDAINKGFDRSTGEIMGWLNSSDLYFPWTLRTVEDIFTAYPEVLWISSLHKTCITEEGAYGSWPVDAFSSRRFASGELGSGTNSNFIQQETCFWRRSLWEQIGSRITDEYRYAGDFWLWSRFFTYARCTGVDAPLAAFRYHGDQRSGATRYRAEVVQILENINHSGELSEMVPGAQNALREWIPSPSGNGGSCVWHLVVHDDDYIDILSYLSENLEVLKWKLSKIIFPLVSATKIIVKLIGFKKNR